MGQTENQRLRRVLVQRKMTGHTPVYADCTPITRFARIVLANLPLGTVVLR